MKALRVLTGTHAGAQIRLTAGGYRLSAEADADICISDWQAGSLVLTLGEDGVARVRLDGGEEVLIADFIAVPYGDVVFCVGPDDTAWPRDLDLLAGLWKTAEPDVPVAPAETSLPLPMASPPKALRTAVVALACTALIGGLMTAGVMLAGSQPTEAANVKFDAGALSKQVAEALRRAGLADLTAAPRGNNVVVRGMVATTDESDAARKIMDGLARGKTLREYDVAQQDVVNIQQSLGDLGARVEYRGKGVFHVSGTVPSLKKFHHMLANVKPDLDANVKRLDVDVKEARSTISDVRYAEVVSVGNLRYIETPDGTKHLLDTAANSRETD